MRMQPVKTSWILSAAVAALLPLLASPVVAGSSSSAGASVSIVAAPSTLGAISNFLINVPLQTQGVQTIDVPAIEGDNIFSTPNDEAITLQPAIFSVSGVPYQAFSIIIPQPSSSVGEAGTVEFMDFEHNAGQTPSIGADGSAAFAVGARIMLSDTGLTPAGGDSGELDLTGEENSADSTDPEDKPLPVADPFGLRAIADGFLQVLVSYN